MSARKSASAASPILSQSDRSKDHKCAGEDDPILFEEIPEERAMYIEKSCYDAKSLLEWVERSHNFQLPHNKNVISNELMAQIKKKANPQQNASPSSRSSARSRGSTQHPEMAERYNLRDLSTLMQREAESVKSSTKNLFGTVEFDDTTTYNIVSWSPAGDKISSIDKNNTLVIRTVGDMSRSLDDWQRLKWDEAKSQISCLAWSPDGSLIAVGTENTGVYVIKASDGKRASRLKVKKPLFGESISYPISSLKWVGNMIYVGSKNHIHVWNVSSKWRPRIEKDISTGDHEITCIAPMPRFNTIATGGKDKTIRVWDLQSGAPIAVLRGHEGEISSLTFDMPKIIDGLWSARLLSSDTKGVTNKWEQTLLDREWRVIEHYNNNMMTYAFDRNPSTMASQGKFTAWVKIMRTIPTIDLIRKNDNGEIINLTLRVPIPVQNERSAYIHSIDINAQGTLLAVGLQGGMVGLYDVARMLQRGGKKAKKLSAKNTSSQTKPTHKYAGRIYVVHTGTRGGKYILVGPNKTKVYV